ncbi:SPFH domain-containing protein [Kiritimatiella glycovorans]|uniref:HflK protein n=1 Tax=Kiritimatiella glycovorans TaxID=1307763 RepID=A0A0G3EET2_9BACT|nr:SPFH domain-containing protein [Kiritimatiella glycovorans]AKJ64803.1 HflK protein [Kiritimatiella glycovorans]
MSSTPRHTDAAQKSATLQAVEASLLRVFALLKWFVVLLLAAFALSGVFFVPEGKVAIRTRFGRIADSGPSRVFTPGGPYFSLPRPLDEVFFIPTTLQQIELDTCFWAEQSEYAYPYRTASSAWDASLVTGDKNLVHLRLSAAYRLASPSETVGGSPALRFVKTAGSMDRARTVVRNALEQGTVHALARTPIEAFYKGDLSGEQIRATAQAALEAMDTGLVIANVSVNARAVPPSVSAAFQAVNLAQSKKAQRIEKAEQQRTALLNEVAGMGAPAMLEAIAAYEQAKADGDAAAIRAAEERVEGVLLSSEMSGQAAAIIQAALATKTRGVEFVRGASERFLVMLELYERNPAFYRDRQIQDALQRIFAGRVETFFLPHGDDDTLYLEMGRRR